MNEELLSQEGGGHDDGAVLVTTKDDVALDVLSSSKDGTSEPRKKKHWWSRGAKKEEKEKVEAVGFFKLFRFAAPWDKLLIVLGSFGAAALGVAFPLFAVIFGGTLTSLNSPDALSSVLTQVYLFIAVGGGAFIAGWLSFASFMYSAERQTKACREAYLRATLRQNMGWFDEHPPTEMSTELVSDTTKFSKGIGEKFAVLIQQTVTVLSGLIIGFVYGYQLALVVLAMIPMIGGSMAGLGVIGQKVTKQRDQVYQKAAGRAEGALGSIKTVAAFSGQEEEYVAYKELLEPAKAYDLRNSVVNAVAMGTLFLVMFSGYALAMWFGAKLIRDGTTNPRTGVPYTGADIMTVFFAIIIGSFGLGQLAPAIPALTEAKVAAFRLFKMIDKKSPIDPLSDEGRKLESLSGNIELKNVSFSYPTRQEDPIFKNFSIECRAGEKIALVGRSGSGKSTAVALFQRFYDVDGGQVLVDGVDIRELNVKWWRQNVGVVSQEPVLFQTSILENIRYGRPDATNEDIRNAAMAANAHKFIMDLPERYSTNCGESGSLLSGGQKQRIAIARAIIRNPTVLLLDEATSALDTESEKHVQKALKEVMKDRTTVIVAHRLSTIRHADRIYVVDDGTVVEYGTHDELMAKHSSYYYLVQSQDFDDSVPDEGEHDEADHSEIGVVVSDDVSEMVVVPKTTSKPEAKTLPLSERLLAWFTMSKKKKGDENGAADEGEEEDPELVQLTTKKASIGRIRKMAPGWFLALGGAGAILFGGVYPAFAIIFSKIIEVFFNPDAESVKTEASWIAFIFFALGLVLFIAQVVKGYGLGVASSRLTFNLRLKAYRSVLSQEMKWFDEPNHNSKVIAGKMSRDCGLVHGATSTSMGAFGEAVAMGLSGLIIAFIYLPQLAAVVLGCAPASVFASMLGWKFMMGATASGEKTFAAASRISANALSEVRTLASFTGEGPVLDEFSSELQKMMPVARNKAHIAGISLGLSQGLLFFIDALAFWYGAKLITDHPEQYSPTDLLTALFAVIISAMGAGQTFQAAPDAGDAREAANNVMYLIDHKSKVDPYSDAGLKEPLTSSKIDFKSVDFTYPSRPNTQILHELGFHIKPGKSLALVGESGSGKSTVVSLLLRFYESEFGTISVGDRDIKDYNLQHYRRNFGLVMQEPDLFDVSIRDNIRYGAPTATDEEIFEAAKKANVHDSILEFQDGYNTICGVKGSKLSGGQKQRVAIARAIVRNPMIILLDEATSALDSKSEKVVQEALNEIIKQKDVTTVVIAHRLSTIKDCDQIGVMDRGRIVEIGSYDELIEKNHVFANLLRASLS